MAHSKEIKSKAYALYMAGIPNVKIAEHTKICEGTLYHIIERENWRELKAQHNEIVKEYEKSDREVIEEKLLNSIEQVWAKLVTQGDAKANARDVIEALKFRRLKEGLSTENIAVQGKVSIEDAYAQFVKERDLRKKGKVEGFVEGVLPGVEEGEAVEVKSG